MYDINNKPIVKNTTTITTSLPPIDHYIGSADVHGDILVTCDKTTLNSTTNKYGSMVLYHKNNDGGWDIVSTYHSGTNYRTCLDTKHDGKTLVTRGKLPWMYELIPVKMTLTFDSYSIYDKFFYYR